MARSSRRPSTPEAGPGFTVGLALRLATDGGRLPVQIVETATRFAIQWNASYRFEDDAFVVGDASGMRAIIGYPVADLRVAERRALRQI